MGCVQSEQIDSKIQGEEDRLEQISAPSQGNRHYFARIAQNRHKRAKFDNFLRLLYIQRTKESLLGGVGTARITRSCKVAGSPLPIHKLPDFKQHALPRRRASSLLPHVRPPLPPHPTLRVGPQQVSGRYQERLHPPLWQRKSHHRPLPSHTTIIERGHHPIHPAAISPIGCPLEIIGVLLHLPIDTACRGRIALLLSLGDRATQGLQGLTA